MAREILGEKPNDPRLTYWNRAWELVEGRPVDPNLVRIVDGKRFAPAMILRRPSTPTESETQSGNPIPNL